MNTLRPAAVQRFPLPSAGPTHRRQARLPYKTPSAVCQAKLQGSSAGRSVQLRSARSRMEQRRTVARCTSWKDLGLLGRPDQIKLAVVRCGWLLTARAARLACAPCHPTWPDRASGSSVSLACTATRTHWASLAGWAGRRRSGPAAV
jgi:hypothetical protein